jgi:hypothetical protein
MTTSLKRLCLEKLSICEFDMHSLPKDFQIDISIMYYKRCLNEIRNRVQKLESGWNNMMNDFEHDKNDPQFYRIYHNASQKSIWRWVNYSSLSEIAEHRPCFFVHSRRSRLWNPGHKAIFLRQAVYCKHINRFVGGTPEWLGKGSIVEHRHEWDRIKEDELLDKRPRKKRRMYYRI